jgi:hypothetical protein
MVARCLVTELAQLSRGIGLIWSNRDGRAQFERWSDDADTLVAIRYQAEDHLEMAN